VNGLLTAAAPVVVGVLNVTPDSFSDGGRYADLAAAVAHGIQMRTEGAAFVDVGGESTRPGADRVDADTERQRVLPVVRELTASGVPVSVDTTRASVAAAALAAGAVVVNDVSGGLADADMVRVVADAGCPWVLMHWRGHSREMATLASYTDVVKEVCAELGARVDAAVAGGVPPDRLVVDPGLGFAKNAEHNWRLAARLDQVVALGFPVLVGASRKFGEREAATVATTVLAVEAGAWGVRVHDVRANADAIAVWRATRAHR
jgi:dihydropteroate synthase